ncbi:uncharacterized protein LOC124287862 [Haliotis rubra]|uniref:uncharacterized protein LOC124287862 n=1 Tax=Haliotis rubra TaxID=36100 RepID=UPI001EE53752|nr:uncharacterized protein LOC124287862 [Haliotis rubra]
MAGVIEPCSTTDKSQVGAPGTIYRTSAIESFITRTRDRSHGFSQHVFVVTRSVQFNATAFLNSNNNGNSKEADSNVETAAAIAGSKSYQGLSKVLASTRQKPRHSYLNRRHPEVHRTRGEGQTRCLIKFDNTCAGLENIANGAVQGISRPNKKRREDTEVLPRCQKTQLPSLEDIDEIESGNQDAHATSDVSVQTEHQCGPPYFSDLFEEVSLVKSVSEVPESVKDGLLLLLCTPLLDGGYQSGGCAWSSLLCDPAGPNHPRPCLAGCQPFHSAVTEVTDITGCYGSSEEQTPVQSCLNSQIKDLSCTGRNRAESPRSFLHEDDVLDIPTLSTLSPSRASLGQAYHSDHAITSATALHHDEDKPASHEPFPSEYVFKRVCGPSFCVSSDFRHIKIPTLPSDIVDYKLESDGLTEIIIGTGSFGKVYAATLTVSPGQSRDVVVKEHFSNRTTQESIANEAKITMYLESTGCVPICYGLLSDEEDGYNIVMEYVGTGLTLYDVLCDSRVTGLHWLNIVCQITSGLNKIHKKDVLINDLKSDNILVDMSGTLPLVKFCDMGSASYKSGVTYRGDMKNCVHLAPEACAHAETTAACDIFSLGRVLKKIHGVSHISTLLTVSDMCMAEDPAVRPTLWTVNQLLQEEYTREVLFPTVIVPSHGYLDSIDEESQEEPPRSILRVNTPVDKYSPPGPGKDEVNGALSDVCTPTDSKVMTRSAKVSPSNMKSTNRENDELLGAPAVLPTERQCKIASASRSPCPRSPTIGLGSEDTSVSTRGHIQHRHDTAVNMTSPPCCNQMLETESQSLDDSSITTEVAEKTSATRKCVNGHCHKCHFSAHESATSAEVVQTTFDVPRKHCVRQSYECHFATPESSFSSEVAEEISVVASMKSDAGQSRACKFATPENSSCTEVDEMTFDVPRIYDAGQGHECRFATPGCSSSVEVVKKISSVGSTKSDVLHECRFATPESSSSTEIPEETSIVATRIFDSGLSHEYHFATPESSSSFDISEETSDVATRAPDTRQSHECHFATPEASSTDFAPHRSQSPTEAPHVAGIRCLCQAELDVQWEDTPVYEDYLPLILPLLMLLFGIVGVV